MGCLPFKCCRPIRFMRKCSSRIKIRKIVLLLVGLDNAGKSSTVKGLAREPASVLPTVGFASVRLKHRGHSVIIYDLGGSPQIRAIWESYFADVHGVMFVVDAGDTSRVDESRKVLEQVLSHDKVSGKPLLLLANKQDVAGALDELDVVDRLDVERLANLHRCPTLVEVCCAAPSNRKRPKMDPGLLNGYRWLLRRIINDYEELNARVERDSEQARLETEADRRRWAERRKNRSTVDGDGDGNFAADPFRPIRSLVGSGSKQNGRPCSPSSSPRPSTATSGRTEVIDEPQPLNVVISVKEQFEEKMRRQKRSVTLRRANRTAPSSAAVGVGRYEWEPIDVRPNTAPPAPPPPKRESSGASVSTIVLRSPRSFIKTDDDDDDVICSSSQVSMVERFCKYSSKII